jgi:predicted neutral ceramidase superfamily lipid hydrolase
VLVVDQPAEKVVEAIVPAGDELVPRREVATAAAQYEELVTDLAAGAFDGGVLRIVR